MSQCSGPDCTHSSHKTPAEAPARPVAPNRHQRRAKASTAHLRELEGRLNAKERELRAAKVLLMDLCERIEADRAGEDSLRGEPTAAARKFLGQDPWRNAQNEVTFGGDWEVQK